MEPNQKRTNVYDPRAEHDACGIGAVVSLKGTPSHATVDNALKIVEKLEHRAGKDASGETGDGVGLIFRRGEIIKKVPQEQLVDALMDEIAQYEGE